MKVLTLQHGIDRAGRLVVILQTLEATVEKGRRHKKGWNRMLVFVAAASPLALVVGKGWRHGLEKRVVFRRRGRDTVAPQSFAGPCSIRSKRNVHGPGFRNGKCWWLPFNVQVLFRRTAIDFR